LKISQTGRLLRELSAITATVPLRGSLIFDVSEIATSNVRTSLREAIPPVVPGIGNCPRNNTCPMFNEYWERIRRKASDFMCRKDPGMEAVERGVMALSVEHENGNEAGLGSRRTHNRQVRAEMR
jgi:hypothetical protein